jgi:ABC-type glycerol-3-phosphate transport system permease component
MSAMLERGESGATGATRGAAIAVPSAQTRGGMHSQRRMLHAALHTTFIVLCLIYLTPFAWLLSTSLKEDGKEISMPPQWIPDPIVWDNYYRAITALPMLWYLRNTLIITVTATALGVLTASLAGYAFGRLRFPGRDILFALCLSALMLPGIVTLIPEFLLYKQIGWINTFLPMIVPWSLGGHTLGIFLFRQHARTIPIDFDEAARVDGAGAFRIWWSIILPLSGPVLATMTILAFIVHWNEFLRPLVFLLDKDMRTLAIGLRLFRSEYLVQWNLLMAASALMLLPVLALFFAAQRYFVQGIVMSGLKG